MELARLCVDCLALLIYYKEEVCCNQGTRVDFLSLFHVNK